VATPEGDIPLKHLPLDVLHRLIARAEAEARALPPPAAEDGPTGEVDALLASVGLRTHQAPAIDLEPLRGELARRINESREVARQRSALYRSHIALGLLEYRERLTRAGLERFIREAGQRLYDETDAPPLYLLVPPAVYHRQLIGIYNIFGAAIAGQPLVLTTLFGPLKVTPSDLVKRITLA
jgi:hypothetical protein